MKREELLGWLNSLIINSAELGESADAKSWGYEEGILISRNEAEEIRTHLSLPPAEGAEEYLKLPQNDGKLKYCPAHFLPTLIQLMEGFAAQPQPTAEGAEEILDRVIGIKTKSDAFKQEIIRAMQEFATLHAQKIADKMVSERLREELMAFLDKRDHTITLSRLGNVDAVDLYLKSREE